MEQLRTLNSYQIFKIKNKKLKTYSGWCPFKGLSNDTTLMQIQSGRMVLCLDSRSGYGNINCCITQLGCSDAQLLVRWPAVRQAQGSDPGAPRRFCNWATGMKKTQRSRRMWRIIEDVKLKQMFTMKQTVMFLAWGTVPMFYQVWIFFQLSCRPTFEWIGIQVKSWIQIRRKGMNNAYPRPCLSLISTKNFRIWNG